MLVCNTFIQSDIYNSLPSHRSQKKETFCVIVSGGEGGDGQDRFTRHTTSSIYHWRGAYPDRVELLPGTNPMAAHHFMVNEFHYLAFANFQNNKGETRFRENSQNRGWWRGRMVSCFNVLVKLLL